MAELIVDVCDLAAADLEACDLAAAASSWPRLAAHRQPWWEAIRRGLRHRGFLITVRCGEQLVGALPLVLVKGPIFGRFLVSLPYVNTGGVWLGGLEEKALPSLTLDPPGGRVMDEVAGARGLDGKKTLPSLTLDPPGGRVVDGVAGARGLDGKKTLPSLTLDPPGGRVVEQVAGARGLDGKKTLPSLTLDPPGGRVGDEVAGEQGLDGKKALPSLTLDPPGGRVVDEVADALVRRACALADELDVKYLELRHESPVEHPLLNFRRTDKVHMRLPLPATDELLDKSFKSKLRSQVRKAGQSEHHVVWGGAELLDDFYDVFAVNMRDLGTPVFSKQLFAEVLEAFAGEAELCVVYQPTEKPLSPAAGDRGLDEKALPSLTLDPPGGRVKGEGLKAVAGALLVHADGVTEVPSASCLRSANPTGANMWMYRQLLRRAVERGSHTFDFGRSSAGSGTYKFKAQWGAKPHPAVWQYYVRKGSVEAMRPDSAGNQRLIRVWQKLPVWLTRIIGPEIVRGIP